MTCGNMPTTSSNCSTRSQASTHGLVALVDRFSDAERVKPLVETNSLKDMLAHITDWETYTLRRLRTTAIGESLPFARARWGL